MFFKISQINAIENQIDDNCLIAFDLDNTLVTSSSYYGSISWENNLILKLEKEGLSSQEAIKHGALLWKQAQFEIKLKLIEKESATLINNWKKTTNIIGLTARTFDIKDLTFECLKSNNITFSSFSDHNLDSFHEGILYCGNFLKSAALLNFIDQVLIKKPKKILFIDDKKENLDDILSSELNKNFIVKCYHYLNDPYENVNLNKNTDIKI